MACQGQAEPHAAVASGGRAVGLLEGIEEPGLISGRDAHAGVAHLEADLQALLFLRDDFAAQPRPAVLGELHRIRQQVDQRLRQPLGVAPQALGQRARVEHELDPLRTQVHLQQTHRAGEELVARELDIFQQEFAGVDLR